MSTKKLNPRSEAALKAGCRCPVMDNSHGKGYLGMKGIFVQNLNCPVHGPKLVRKTIKAK